MRKLILILFILFIVPRGTFGQVSTNKIQNMATLMLTNSTLSVGGTNNSFNMTQYAASDIITVYGQDGVIDLVPRLGLIHSRLGIAFYTNNTRTISGWSISQDPLGAQSHEFGISDNINGVIRLHFVSNQHVRVHIPFLITSSNFVASNTVSAAGYLIGSNPGATAWSTNVGIGVTNVLVFTNGLFMGQFLTP